MQLRVGVVGLGFGTKVHVPAFLSEGVDVIALCSRNAARASEVAATFGVAHAFGSFDEMLTLPDLDAVSIASPARFHGEMVEKALEAGKHVLCEKPFVLSAAEARQLRDRADALGLTAMVAHEFRFSPSRQLVRELVDDGYIGEVRLLTCRMFVPAPGGDGPPPFNEERDVLARGGGMLFALGSHYIDGFRHLLGREVAFVSGRRVASSPDRLRDGAVVQADADDTFAFTLTLRGGGMVQMTAARVAAGAESSIAIYGSEGTLVTPQYGPNPPERGEVLGARRGERSLVPIEIPARLEQITDERDDRLAAFRYLVREFVRGIAEGVSPAPNFDDAYRCQLVLDAIGESSHSGRGVEIPEE